MSPEQWQGGAITRATDQFAFCTVWSPAIASEMRAKTSDVHTAALDAAFRDWQTARAAACTASPQLRTAQLHCLDSVLERFDVLRQAFARAPGSVAEEIQGQLIDPTICRKSEVAEVPRLTLTPTPEVIAAYELLARSTTRARPAVSEITALTDVRKLLRACDRHARARSYLRHGMVSTVPSVSSLVTVGPFVFRPVVGTQHLPPVGLPGTWTATVRRGR
jgi:hypothetical protein